MAELSKEAKEYADKLFPCEKPCDSWGICDGCAERICFEAGYSFGLRTVTAPTKESEMILLWAPFNREADLFDRIVFHRWWIRRQQLFMNAETNELTWKDVPLFKKRLK